MHLKQGGYTGVAKQKKKEKKKNRKTGRASAMLLAREKQQTTLHTP